MNAVNVYNEVSAVATPKARINGWNIWDVRHLDRKAGWFVTCQNEDHQESYQYETLLSYAKQFAESYNCEDCALEYEDRRRNGQIQALEFEAKRFEDYINNSRFVWQAAGTYSGGRHGGATELKLGFGIASDSHYQFHGATVEGEVFVTVEANGTVTTNYAIKTWEDGERVFIEFGTNRAAFDSKMFELLAPLEKEFTAWASKRYSKVLTQLTELRGN